MDAMRITEIIMREEMFEMGKKEMEKALFSNLTSIRIIHEEETLE